MFYFPPISPDLPQGEWEFLRKQDSITMLNATASYSLPDDFGGTMIDNSISFAGAQRTLKKQTEEELRQMTAMEPSIGQPLYYAIEQSSFVAANGTRWSISLYPVPGPTENNTAMQFRYARIPDLLTNTNIYPIGGAQYGQTLLYAFLAAAEDMVDDGSVVYQQKFEQSLAQAVRVDMDMKNTEPNLDT